MLTVHSQHAAILRMLLIPGINVPDYLSVWQKLLHTRLASDTCGTLLFRAF